MGVTQQQALGTQCQHRADIEGSGDAPVRFMHGVDDGLVIFARAAFERRERRGAPEARGTVMPVFSIEEAGMERSGFGTVRRTRSGRYQARVRVRGRQIAIGTFDTRRGTAQALVSFAASYGSQSLVDRGAARQNLGEFAESWCRQVGASASQNTRIVSADRSAS